MSSRIHSDFGTLGERANANTQHSGEEGIGNRPRHVEVFCDPHWQPGVLVRWVRTPDGWKGHCAWVEDEQLRVDLIDANRFRPIS